MPLSGLTGNTQLYTCVDKFKGNLKFHVGFFNAFLLCFRKVLYKNSPLKCSRRAYYVPFAVLRYISENSSKLCSIDTTFSKMFRTFKRRLREKGRLLTQSCDKSPYTNRNVKREHDNTKTSPKRSITQRLRTNLGRSDGEHKERYIYLPRAILEGKLVYKTTLS